eukprot:NODE_5524_length_1761_cov_5.170135.p1 GENE.NODE_5524_length_1761_cov_5.170135~~NODE_5524_length_1761_cov_5.170135.p1  ORF type:complete len:185 (-),score=27.01 NODE_5524_length_1761_cov_5.170135:876-1430(-)
MVDMLRNRQPTWQGTQLYSRVRLINAALLARMHTMEWRTSILSNGVLDLSVLTNWNRLNTLVEPHIDPRTLNPVPDSVTGSVNGTALRAVLFGIVGGRHKVPVDPLSGDDAAFFMTEEFVSVYRMHPLRPEHLSVLGEAGTAMVNIPLSKTRNRASRKLLEQHGMKTIMQGLGTQRAMQLTPFN